MASTLDIATILAGQSLSDVITLDGTHHIAGILLPAGWTAASISFAASGDGSTGSFVPVVDDQGVEISRPGTANRWIMLPPSLLYGVRYLQIRSGTSGAAVAQAAQRAIQVTMRRYT